MNDFNTVGMQSSHHKIYYVPRSLALDRHIYVEGKLKESGMS